MCIEHRVHRPKRLVDIKHIVQCTFSRNKDGFSAIEGFIDIAHNATRAVAWYLSATEPLVVFAIADSQNIGQHSRFTCVTKISKNRLRHLL